MYTAHVVLGVCVCARDAILKATLSSTSIHTHAPAVPCTGHGTHEFIMLGASLFQPVAIRLGE